MSPINSILTTVVVLGGAQAALADSINVFLDEDSQGKGNKGVEFRPVDELGDLVDFVITARSSIDDDAPFDPNASGSIGTVYVNKKKDGTGVQDSGTGGSKGVSGGGGDKDEELIFTFDNSTLASNIMVELVGFKPFKDFKKWEPGDAIPDDAIGKYDDTVLFLDIVGSDDMLVLNETQFVNAFAATDKESGVLDFGLLGLGPDVLIDAFVIRETNGHIGVAAMALAAGTVVPLPAPLALGLVGLAGVGVARRRKLLVK